MNPDKQRIAIAEACGITPKRERTNPLVFPGVEVYWNCPDYLNDLNAMHEAEEYLRENLGHAWLNYCFALADRYIPDISAIHAPAVERAEEFLKAIGKWEEE